MLKKQDILVAVKLSLRPTETFSVRILSEELYISATEAHNCLKRLKKCNLIDDNKQSIKANLLLFIRFGLKFVFPPEETTGKGLKTGIDVYRDRDSFPDLIWVDTTNSSSDAGKTCLKPLHGSLIPSCKNDPLFHKAMAAIEDLRVGRNEFSALSYLEAVL